MWPFDLIYNKDSLHIVNALRITMLLAIITSFTLSGAVYAVIHSKYTVDEFNNYVDAFFSTIIGVLSASSVTLIGAGIMDLAKY